MVSDQDIETLDAMLDNQLTSQEQVAVEARLAGDAEFSRLLGQLREDRRMRASAWESLAPTELTVDDAIQRFEQSLDRRSWFQSLVSQWPRMAVAAACVAMFAIGMYFRDEYAGSGRSPMHMTQPVNMVFENPNGALSRPRLELRVNDPSGQPVAIQQFGTLEEAENYLARLRLQQQLSAPPPLPQ